MKLRSPRWLVTLLICVCVAATSIVSTGIVLRGRYAAQLQETQAQLQDAASYKKLDEIKALVDQYYVGTYDEQEIMDGLSDGFISSIGDKWAYYTPVDEVQSLTETKTGQYSGIGVTASYETDTGLILITGITKGGAAEAAGIRVSDRIYSVEGELVEDLGFNGAVYKIRGEEGTTVRVQILRGDILTEYTLERRMLEDELVTAELLEGRIGYIRVESFATATDNQFAEKLQQLKDLSPEGLIIDVRNNGGGSIKTLVDMLDLLMPQGVAVLTAEKNGEEKETTVDDQYWDIPLVVLANEYSISAAEYFAAVLQETGRATVVGNHTTGKGEGQSTFTLSDGSLVSFSTMKYYTPSGVSLSEVGGIAPNIEVEMTYDQIIDIGYVEANEDPQIAKAIEVLTNGAKQ